MFPRDTAGFRRPSYGFWCGIVLSIHIEAMFYNRCQRKWILLRFRWTLTTKWRPGIAETVIVSDWVDHKWTTKHKRCHVPRFRCLCKQHQLCFEHFHVMPCKYMPRITQGMDAIKSRGRLLSVLEHGRVHSLSLRREMSALETGDRWSWEEVNSITGFLCANRAQPRD